MLSFQSEKDKADGHYDLSAFFTLRCEIYENGRCHLFDFVNH